MGAYRRGESCKAVNNKHMLNVISEKYYKNDLGLICDDGLTLLKNKNGMQSRQEKPML